MSDEIPGKAGRNLMEGSKAVGAIHKLEMSVPSLIFPCVRAKLRWALAMALDGGPSGWPPQVGWGTAHKSTRGTENSNRSLKGLGVARK